KRDSNIILLIIVIILFGHRGTLLKQQEVVNSAKWGNKKRCGMKKHFLELYLIEFMWRICLGEQNAFETYLFYLLDFYEFV
ncbi:putative transposase-like protein, partial [Aphis craccivora]